jgi:hypothetical protein
MTDKTQLVTFTAEERAILDGTSTVKVEETDGGADVLHGDDAASKADVPGTDRTASPGKTEADAQQEAEQEEAEPDEEVTEVADGTNPDGAPKRKVIAFSAYDTPPDKTKDPEGYLKWLETAAQETIRIRRQSVQHAEQSSQFQQINQAVYEHEQAFIKGDPDSGTEAHPDFLDAVTFLREKQTRELKTAGYEQHEINQIMAARAQDISLRALKAGDSPAKRVYSLAKLNGYKAAAPAKVETEAEKIARQAKSQEKAGKTISSLPGGESKGGLTADTLANMSPEAFKKLWDSGEAKALLGWKD